MAEEHKGVALAILGIVAVIAVVGLILLFKGAATGNIVAPGAKLYGGGGINHGTDQYTSDYKRYADNRVYAGALYAGNIQYEDTGGQPVPTATIDSDPKRTGSVINNQCPFPPYLVPTRTDDAGVRTCIPSGYNPETGEQVEIGVTRRERQLCCMTEKQENAAAAQ